MLETRELDIVPRHGRPASLAVHCTGRGRLAILLHGYPLDHRMWLDTLHGPLAAQRRLCAPDLRGHGRSPWAGDPVHTMDLLADDAAAVIQSLGDGPADVVGLSMGGYVALALAVRHPQLCASLVLAHTRAAADSQAAREGRDAAVRTVAEQGRAAIAAAMLPKLLPAGADPLLAARVRSMVEGTAAETIVADLRGLRNRPDRTAVLPQLGMPALVLTGSADPITPPADAELLVRGLPQARLHVVAGAAHLSPMEQPDAFAAAVAAFWR